MLGRVPVPHSVAREIQKQILGGEIKVGDKLPSQRVLSKQFNISRASLREALLTLETLGFIRTEPGRGTFVSTNDPTHRGEISDWRYGGESPVHEVYQTRLYLETLIVNLAAGTCTPEDLEKLEAAADGMENSWEKQDLIATTSHDFDFHQIIVAACSNRNLRHWYESTRNQIMEAQRHPLPVTRPCRFRESMGEHREIIEALRKGDGDKAASVMQRHIIKTAKAIGLELGKLPTCT